MRLIVFDIDGTILLNGPITRRLFGESFAEVVGREPESDTVRFHGNTDRGIFRLMLGADVDYERHFDAFAAAFTRRMRDHYATAEGPHVLPGARELVEALHGHQGAALALGTGNIRDSAYVKLARFGLDRYFPVGGFGGDHEVRADLVRAALDDARSHYDVDFDPAEVWVIGDTVNDVEAARAAGCRVMAVRTGPHGESELSAADHVVADLSATSERLTQLLDLG
ncbi:MAG TPA: HAD family hydrolase [Candidatus Krumholzibacteria bacterium]|nr:HAD family hydrolase [Candidatus Krumholzibacteria bacterium]